MEEIFGIGRDKLNSIVTEVACEEVDSFELSLGDGVNGNYGIMGEKGIWILSYVTKSGRRVEKKVFVKKYYDSLSKEEGYHYKCLKDYDAPVSRFYGSLRDGKGRETLFLEYLNVVAEDEASFSNDTSKLKMLIEVIARFNAIQPCGDYAGYLEEELEARSGPDDWEERMNAVALSLDDIWNRGLAGELGSSVKGLCKSHYRKKIKLQAHAKKLIKLIKDTRKGLCHRDFAHNCTGWRNGGELVIFDLGDVGLDARFTDVALLLGAPQDDPQPKRQEFIKHYLSEYAHRTALNVSSDQFLFETKILWQALTLWDMYLYWWNDRLLDKGVELMRLPDAKDNVEKTKLGYREGIYTRLKTFLEGVRLKD